MKYERTRPAGCVLFVCFLNDCSIFACMKKEGFILVIRGVVSAAIFMLFLCGCVRDREEGAFLREGDMLPEFEAVMSDGSCVSGEMLRKQVSCIVFFNTSCPDCRKELPSIQRLYDGYASKGVSFAVISRSEGYSSVMDYWRENGLEMPFSAQDTRHVYSLFANSGIPRVYMSGKDGIIRHVFADNPVPSYDELESALSGLLQ